MTDPFLKAVSDFGVAVAMLVVCIGVFWFFLRWVKKRDEENTSNNAATMKRLGEKLDAAHEAHLKDLRDSIGNNTQAMLANVAASNAIRDLLNARPCLLPSQEQDRLKRREHEHGRS